MRCTGSRIPPAAMDLAVEKQAGVLLPGRVADCCGAPACD